jgi:DNA-binding CsgD family transcriptional regulator
METSIMDTAAEREAIVRLYAAAAGEQSWAGALEAIGVAVSAPTVALLAQVDDAREPEVLSATVGNPDALRAIRGCFSGGRVLMTEGLTEHGTIRLAALRPPDHPPFAAADVEAFAVLAPHLRQAIRLGVQCERANELRGAMQALGEQFGKGVAVLDTNGRVRHANAMFERICAVEDGLTARRGVLATSRLNEPAFSRLLARGMRGESGGRLDILRPSGSQPYSLMVSPMTETSSLLGAGRARVTVVVSDPTAVRAPMEATLSVAYGLTRAESRMVARLVDGATVGATAEQLGISLNTARTHLKRAMAKTGVSRQTDLVRLLLTRQ